MVCVTAAKLLPQKPPGSFPAPVLFWFCRSREGYYIVHFIDKVNNILWIRDIGSDLIESFSRSSHQYFEVADKIGNLYRFLEWNPKSGEVKVVLDQHEVSTHVNYLKNTENFHE